MIKEKNKLISAIESLDERNFDVLCNTEEYHNLEKYYENNGLDTNMAIYDLFNIKGLYVKGNMVSYTKSIRGVYMILHYGYDNAYNDMGEIVVSAPLLRTINIPDLHMLDDICPEDGVEIEIDLQELNYETPYIAKSVKCLNKMVYPLKVCPICKTIYRDNNDDKTTKYYCGCSDSQTSTNYASLKEFDSSYELFKFINNIHEYIVTAKLGVV